MVHSPELYYTLLFFVVVALLWLLLLSYVLVLVFIGRLPTKYVYTFFRILLYYYKIEETDMRLQMIFHFQNWQAILYDIIRHRKQSTIFLTVIISVQRKFINSVFSLSAQIVTRSKTYFFSENHRLWRCKYIKRTHKMV